MKIPMIQLYNELLGIFVKNSSEKNKEKCFKEFKEKYPFVTVFDGETYIKFL